MVSFITPILSACMSDFTFSFENRDVQKCFWH